MIVSLVYQVAGKLLAFPALLHLTRPVRYEPADRLWFAALSSLIPRCRWANVFPMTPATRSPAKRILAGLLHVNL
ncbi:hypothetical protein [Streptomyces coffeae]|uniref:Uncharacterized protein n=1 Tax=Streptomyces coffeae TaxID=621382 RepID=A0ABS1NCG2_9ACTN|nr:hypothetical protein [Streptomyces coffeae]MBL1097771.1 hypothetical protein [Streptomyces coffeae]